MQNKQNDHENPNNTKAEKCMLCNLLTLDPNTDLGVPICKQCWGVNWDQFKFFKENRTQFFPEIDQINEKVYLGNEDAQRNKENLKNLGITHILVVGYGLDIFHPNDFEYKKFNASDFPTFDMSQFFEEAFNFIEKSEKVFVHCAAGVSRSATIVIAYFMKKNKWTLSESYAFVKSKRPVIFPNGGFMKQLEKYKPNNE